MEELRHWSITVDEDNKIFWFTLDRDDASANSINLQVLKELEGMIDTLSQDKKFDGLVFQTGKKNGFIVGADIQQFNIEGDTDRKQALSIASEMIATGQRVFNKIENLRHTTVAMIDGFCLGGGLELALACNYRVACKSSKTRMGLPEVLLGFHPGWGGTVRLPKLTGIINAMDLILSGRTVTSKAAKKMGFVDIAVADRYLKPAAIDCIRKKPKQKKESFFQSIMQLGPVRPFIAKIFRNKVSSKAKQDHYPAPYAAIELWEKYGSYDDKALFHEMQSFEKMIATKQSQNLLRVFFLRESLKGLGKSGEFSGKHVHVLGAGVMGGDIAAWAALRGFRVTLQDTNVDAIAGSFKRAAKLFKRKLKEPHLIQHAKDRLMPDVDGIGVSIADVIIEAIVENPKIKQDVFSNIEANAKPSAILATNTSTIPLEEIGKNMKDPGRLVGIHFFNPVPQMPLVEIVYSAITSNIVKESASAFVGKLDKLPLPVKSSPGFLVNRCLLPYLLEAVSLYEEGVPATVIDKAATDFGMPMGPVELADTVGLDVCKACAESLGEKLPPVVDTLISKGRLGRKTGEGFYVYNKGKPVKGTQDDKSGKSSKEIADRLILRMLNEAVACLREGIVADKELLDAGMIFGTGFAPFRGGPMNYIEDTDITELTRKLEGLAESLGDRFKADTGWAAA